MYLGRLKLPLAVYFSIAVFYMEIVLRIFTCARFFTAGLFIVPLFCVTVGLTLQAACSPFSFKQTKNITLGVQIFLFFLYSTQAIYHGFFGKYLIVYSFLAGGADQVLSEGILENTIMALVSGIPAMLLFALPAVATALYFDRFVKAGKRGYNFAARYIALATALHIAITVGISYLPNFSVVQNGLFDPNLSVSRFGLLRTETLDLKYNLFGIEQKAEMEPEKPAEKPQEQEVPELNITDIDFSSIEETDRDYRILNEYFADREGTYKNEYTGMYEGYNLIYIVAEGFSPYAIDPKLTPTLYKMQQEGFKFNNFYTPIWGVSTSDGEYTACTGLLPKSGVWSFYNSSKNYMPFCLGNMFKGIGVTYNYAYHNHSYSYYHRDMSHPNMGYIYKGVGSGVEKYVSRLWPESDLEMIAGSVGEYLKKDEPFHAYYMTVSGHLSYTKEGNSMAAKNWDFVKGIDCSETLKAYYACNIELDRALEKLLLELNEAGVADKTVIAITPDHYPYGLENEDADKYAVWRELLGRDVEPEFELYKSCFLLYCQGTENAPAVDKYCYSVDILPTLLNLFGFKYDSRLLVGSDIMSTSEGLVIFADRSFITDKGRYSTLTESFTPFKNAVFPQGQKEYVENIKAVVNNKFKVSAQILEEDYYGYLKEKGLIK